MHEDVVHAFHDAVPVHPDVVSVAVRPVPVDPNPIATNHAGLFHHDGPRGRWSLLGHRKRLGLLNDDDRLPIDFLGLSVFGVDDHIGGWIHRLAVLPFVHVAVTGDVELVGAGRAVTVRPSVVGRRGVGGGRRHT